MAASKFQKSEKFQRIRRYVRATIDAKGGELSEPSFGGLTSRERRRCKSHIQVFAHLSRKEERTVIATPPDCVISAILMHFCEGASEGHLGTEFRWLCRVFTTTKIKH